MCLCGPANEKKRTTSHYPYHYPLSLHRQDPLNTCRAGLAAQGGVQ